MTLLAVVKDVCATVGVVVPESVFGGIANNRTMQEMLSLANEMGQRIAYDTRDWTALRTVFIGDGADATAEYFGSSSFVIPANYKRMLLTTNLWSSASSQQPLRFVPDMDEWTQHRISSASAGPVGEWIISGGKIFVHPAPSGGTTITYVYLDKNCVALASGGYGDTFMADTDRFRLDERLLKLGMVWQWKAQKGSPYAEDMGSYSDALANAMGHDAPAPILIDRRPISHAARVAYPWPLPS